MILRNVIYIVLNSTLENVCEELEKNVFTQKFTKKWVFYKLITDIDSYIEINF